MPYFITDQHPECPNWAVVKEDGELLACHDTKDSAVEQMVAVSIDEDLEPGGTYEGDFRSNDEFRAVDLKPPAFMRASARRGLKWYEEGKGGDGLVDATIREARAMARGSVTANKWVRLRAWISRHISDLDSPAANPDNDQYPSAGVVAMALWGGGTSKRTAKRALDYADRLIGRIEQENSGRAKGEAVMKMETRVYSTDLELRESENGMTFEGYAAVFNSWSEPLPFKERINPGAFRGSLRARNDIKLLWNHDTGSILGSTRAGTLTLTEDDKGLKVRAELPNTSQGRDAAELLRRGDIDSMSFGFSVPKGGDEWNAEGTERTLKAIRVHEVSIVAFPAYPATAGTATVRGLDKIAKRADVDADALADALMKLENGEDITIDDRNLLSTVIDKLSPQEENVAGSNEEPEEETKGDLGLLQLKKKKLQLLMGEL